MSSIYVVCKVLNFSKVSECTFTILHLYLESQTRHLFISLAATLWPSWFPTRLFYSRRSPLKCLRQQAFYRCCLSIDLIWFYNFMKLSGIKAFFWSSREWSAQVILYRCYHIALVLLICLFITDGQSNQSLRLKIALLSVQSLHFLQPWGLLVLTWWTRGSLPTTNSFINIHPRKSPCRVPTKGAD